MNLGTFCRPGLYVNYKFKTENTHLARADNLTQQFPSHFNKLQSKLIVWRSAQSDLSSWKWWKIHHDCYVPNYHPIRKFGTLFPIWIGPIPLLELIKTALLQIFLCVLRVIKSPQVTWMGEFESLPFILGDLMSFLHDCSLVSPFLSVLTPAQVKEAQ